MAQAAIALSTPHQTCNPNNAIALKNEWMAATYVWVNLKLNSPKQRRLHGHLATIEARLRSAALRSNLTAFHSPESGHG